jgi:hypothetical protein
MLSHEFRKLAEESRCLTGWKIGECELQAFAELIVKECASISENYAGGSMPLSIAMKIKEHFGVQS